MVSSSKNESGGRVGHRFCKYALWASFTMGGEVLFPASGPFLSGA